MCGHSAVFHASGGILHSVSPHLDNMAKIFVPDHIRLSLCAPVRVHTRHSIHVSLFSYTIIVVVPADFNIPDAVDCFLLLFTITYLFFFFNVAVGGFYITLATTFLPFCNVAMETSLLTLNSHPPGVKISPSTCPVWGMPRTS